jgi:hypothetical protein
MQYGWVQIKWAGCMDSGDPHNKYAVKDYACGDVGIRSKQGRSDCTRTRRKSHRRLPKSAGAAPLSGAQGSLGLLALGAVGLQAWRRRRRADY